MAPWLFARLPLEYTLQLLQLTYRLQWLQCDEMDQVSAMNP